jgi:hypothetical protein
MTARTTGIALRLCELCEEELVDDGFEDERGDER